MQIIHHVIRSMLLSGQVPFKKNSSHFFWNFKDPILVETLFYMRKITCPSLLTDFSQNLISMQDVEHIFIKMYQKSAVI